MVAFCNRNARWPLPALPTLEQWQIPMAAEHLGLEVGIRQDGPLVNAMTKMGTSRDRNTHTKVGLPSLLSRQEIEALYAGSWLCRRVVHLWAGEATRCGWDIGLGDGEKKTARKNSDKLVAYGERRKLRRYVREAMRQSRLYGGAALLVLVDDGTSSIQGLGEEINWKRLRTVKGFHVLDRDKIWPSSSWAGVGEPEQYEFNTEADPALARVGLEGHNTITIHASRVLRFEGDPAPVDMRGALNWWGMSVLQGLWDVFKRYETGQQSASQILHDFDLFVHKIPDLARMLSAGKEDEITRRFEIQALVRSVYGALLLGGQEEGNYISRSAAGISDVLESLKVEVTGATGIPHTKLWGESPSGMGSTGRSEDQAFSADVADLQDEVLAAPLRQFYELAMKAQDAPFRDPPEDWLIKFKPTYVRTEEETADLYQKVSSAHASWVSSRILQPHEIAVGAFGRPEFSLDITLIDRETDGSIKQEDFDPNQVSFGGGMAPPALDANGQLDPKPPAQPYPGPAGAQVQAPPARADAAEEGEACCQSCAQGLECEAECDGSSCDEPPADPPDAFEAVRGALSPAMDPPPTTRRGRQRADAREHTGMVRVAGCAVMARGDGTGQLVGPYGEQTNYRAVLGRGDSGAFEVLSAAGDWFLVLGHNDPQSLQAAAGAGAQIRRIDSIDLTAMGIRCDAYGDEG